MKLSEALVLDAEFWLTTEDWYESIATVREAGMLTDVCIALNDSLLDMQEIALFSWCSAETLGWFSLIVSEFVKDEESN